MKNLAHIYLLLLPIFFSCRNSNPDKNITNSTTSSHTNNVEQPIVKTLDVKIKESDSIPGNYPQASQRFLKDGDLNNLLKPELEEMRNEILARNGYIFKTAELNTFYKEQSWYNPDSTNIISKLSSLEKANLKLIKRFVTYADQYGDDFGR